MLVKLQKVASKIFKKNYEDNLNLFAVHCAVGPKWKLELEQKVCVLRQQVTCEDN